MCCESEQAELLAAFRFAKKKTRATITKAAGALTIFPSFIIRSSTYRVGMSVRLLLSARAAVDHEMQDGDTSLFMASQQGHAECVRLLLGANASH